MRSLPTEPTAALAALISGNHRHIAVRRSASAKRDEVGFSHGVLPFPEHSAKPFALLVTADIDAEGLQQVVDTPEGTLLVFAAEGLPTVVGLGAGGVFESVVATAGIVLLVVLTRLVTSEGTGRPAPAQTLLDLSSPAGSPTGSPAGSILLAEAERRSFDTLESAILGSGTLRARLERRQVRAVAAVLDTAVGRIHWLGEHPNQSRLLRGS